ncbi:MAG: hypothetical protein IJT70_07120 [Clostridia bacterium]|nr:hypothetical protein [Clostridia bacterium]
MKRYKVTSQKTVSSGGVRYYMPTIIVVSLGLLAAIIFLGYMIRKKTPATFETVWETVKDHGFTPSDTTEDNKTFFNGIEKCLAFKSGDINFLFFTSVDASHAADVYVNSLAPKIRELTNQRTDPYRNRRGEFNTNYATLALKGEGKWGIAYYVGNTGGYAWCDEENKDVLIAILKDIGYLD